MAKKVAKKPSTGAAKAKGASKKAASRGGTSPDTSLMNALERRAKALAEALPAGDENTFDATFEQRVLEDAREAGGNGLLSDAAIVSIYKELIASARASRKTVRAAYLGPPFSFTHLAAVEKFGQSADLVPVETISSVFEEVNRGHCDFGVVPIENSTDGRIVDTLDMFTRLPVKICGEVQTRIHHHLLSRTPRGEIVEIYSKPQALSQCRDWLARNMPAAVKHSVTSTSTAAQLAHDKPGAAAVASRQAAVKYGLEIVASGIEDSENNVTRFAIIGDDPPKPTKNDRTSLLLEIPHKAGALADALTIFKSAKLNLTWIESFPLRGEESGAYLFFLDVEGHQSDAKLKKVLASLDKMAKQLHVLGSYPKSEPSET